MTAWNILLISAKHIHFEVSCKLCLRDNDWNVKIYFLGKIRKTRLCSWWHAIANPHASGRNCPCTTQHSFKQPGKILLVCYSTHQFDTSVWYATWPCCEKLNFWPRPTPQVPPQRVFLGSQSKSCSICFTSITTEYMCTFSHKNL